ncbi:MAG: hypothetical protein ACYDAG_12245 [Chloroflexota bacterium]
MVTAAPLSGSREVEYVEYAKRLLGPEFIEWLEGVRRAGVIVDHEITRDGVLRFWTVSKPADGEVV